MAQRVELRPHITAVPAAPVAKSNLSVTVEPHGKVVVLRASNGEILAMSRHDLIKPTLTFLGATQGVSGYEYTYQIKNDASAEEAANDVVFHTAGRSVIWFDPIGARPGETVQFSVKSPLPPGKDAVAYIRNMDEIKQAGEYDRFKASPAWEPHSQAVSREAMAAMTAAFPNAVKVTVEGPSAAGAR
jgi:hypothetical protein